MRRGPLGASCAIALAAMPWTGCDDGAQSGARPGGGGPPGAATASPEATLVEVAPEEVDALLRARPERVLLVNVWSTWCEPCVEELPELVRLARSYEDRGLGVLFLSADAPRQREEALAFLRAQGAPMPGYVKTGSDDAFIRALHPDWSGSLPATMLFDAERRRHALWEEPVDRETLSGPIERLLAARR